MNIIDALHSKTIFAPLFKSLKTWHAWEVYLRGLFELPIASTRVLIRPRPSDMLSADSLLGIEPMTGIETRTALFYEV